MKSMIVLLLAVAAALAIPISDEKVSGEGGWYVPQLNGSLQWMTEEEAEALSETPTSRSTTRVYYYLYTNENPTTADMLVTDDTESLQKSHFNKNNPTKIIIHGWQSNAKSDLITLIRDAYLSKGDYNIIAVDWSDKAETINYIVSASHVAEVGAQVAGFIDFLYQEGGLSFETLHVIGHSLGAHISGFAGKNVEYGTIERITGLDPALPLFSYDKPAKRLNQNDAAYVESIQTCGGRLGFLKPIGKGAFYPNGGKSQPGCGIDLVGTCAHSRSYIYFAEAVRKDDFPCMKCGDWEKAVENNCGVSYSSIRMAAHSNYVNAFGDFYVPVNKVAPYGRGG
ncbi:phospholipase A1 VesT1.02-like [Anastrepha ludens]|uniref:phospholipase A1 VesT1.02-like n=1 Tax=Anastrepha ludens TaxID=28586 RepID=UPI0023B013A6|nr:phospholipase A1 VesT1.02-like [Anastrepha ludens]XP_053959304.1 phospholipase A1 VesT1.02-like [Anastrepha ludens]XP_053959305.1 phospholipase A1 VesT1.02-like [Anastrepha ludens]XP_053959306.1 phospholipase A1 VesT1.02-like [Anastrepha ludens]